VRAGAIAVLLVGLVVAPAFGERTISNGKVSVTPLGSRGSYTGFRVSSGGRRVVDVGFGSVGNITASRLRVEAEHGPGGLRGETSEIVHGTLTFSRLAAVPTPALGRGSCVRVHLDKGDPFPRVEFSLQLRSFDARRWEQVLGRVPFHFLTISVPGSEIFHQRGWPIPTPTIDHYPLQNTGEGYGVQIRSFWSRDWTYAPPLGACPLATAGLWTPSKRHYVALDFHEARLGDHSERDIATAYCWRLDPLSEIPRSQAARELVALVWPYARPYQKLRYPEPGRHLVASHCRILYSLDMASDADPNRFVTRFVWERFADKLPGVPRMSDVSWLSAPFRYSDFPVPTGPPRAYYRVAKPKWWKTDTIDLAGVVWDGDPITYLYETKNQAAIEQMKADVALVLRYTQQVERGGERCCFWPKPLEGEAVDMFGPDGVRTLHAIQGWQFALMLLDICRNDPAERQRLLPYVDGALRFTRHILYTRNGYADVPCAQFCWGAGPVTSFCLRYHYTFRDDPERRELAQAALKLAHAMLYRYLPIWASDSNPYDELDSAFLLEPNSGISWLGAACSNEVWVVPHAVAQVYLATGDPVLGHYLRGMLERWHWLFRDEFYPNVAAYGNAYTERLGLYDGSAQPLGTRATFGGLWGLFERYCWPVGNARVRVLCGEKAAMAFNSGGTHTDVADYRYYRSGAFSFRLVPLGEWCKQAEPFEIAVTFPYYDLRSASVACVSKGFLVKLDDKLIKRFPQRPDTIALRGMRYGDTIAIGGVPNFAVKPLPRAVARERGSFERKADAGPFVTVPIASHCNTRLKADWDDPTSWAGLPAGRIRRLGVPLHLVDPLLHQGRRAARDTSIPVGRKARHLFVLVANAGEGASLEVVYSRRRRRAAPLAKAVPVLRGWPACFRWHADLVAIDTRGRTVEAVEGRGLDVLAVTAFRGERDELAATLDALEAKREAIAAERRATASMRQLAPAFARLSGHIAILPQPLMKNPYASPIVKMLHRAGLLRHVLLLSPQQLVDPKQFNAQRIWVALYVGGEDYWATVRRPGDGADALRRYMRAGGTLVAMARGPFPFYYAATPDKAEPAILARDLGLPICGSGALDRDDKLHGVGLTRRVRQPRRAARDDDTRGVSAAGWEKPPQGVELTFHLNPDQRALAGLPKRFPFPPADQADPRWRPIVHAIPPGNVYTPLLTLRDAAGHSYGEAAAVIDYKAGPLAGARVAYVWSSLLAHPDYQEPLLLGMLRHVLGTTQPPLARHVCVRAGGAIEIDGKLDEPAWAHTDPVALAHCFGTRHGKPPLATAARLLWDDANLYVAFECTDPDIFGRPGPRDSELWEEEVVEVYLDPDGDGRDYREFEVNPRNAVIDLLIPAADQVKGDRYKRFRLWNAYGWRSAVHVDGTVGRRDDTDRRWTVEMAIPLASLAPRHKLPPRRGDAWRLQLYRIDRSKPLGEKPQFAAWSPTDTFHAPGRFGVLVFGSNPAREDFALYRDGADGRPTWQPSAGAWRIEKGKLIGTDCVSDSWQVVGVAAGSDAWRDYRLKLRFQILELASDHRDGPWIAFRHTGPGSCYSLNLGRRIQLHKNHRGRATGDHTCLAHKQWEPDDQWHTLEIRVAGSRIATQLDGKPLLEATDASHLGVPPVPTGGIALSARRWSRSDGHTRVAFDDIEIDLLR